MLAVVILLGVLIADILCSIEKFTKGITKLIDERGNDEAIPTSAGTKEIIININA